MEDRTISQKAYQSVVRPPVVVIMGHIDHGKTTLLDYIRKTNVVAKESGGITQHIGAYEITHDGRKITFLDTPGHEVFSRMRARGARIADIGILVVAADDGVKPQTKEALKAIQDAHLPFIVAVNKVDKPSANIEKVKSELAEEGVLVEGWGGQVPITSVSGKTGEGVSTLLDLVLLASDVEEFSGDPEAPASGVIIESHLDARRGPVASILIKNGTLHRGDVIVAGEALASIKVLEDDMGTVRESATFSSPMTVLGFTTVPKVGDLFTAYEDKKSADEALTAAVRMRSETTTATLTVEDGVPVVPLVIKADVAGSLEALEGEVAKLVFAEIRPRIVKSDVGDVVDDDIKSLASEKGGVVAGFKVRSSPSARSLAERFGIEIRTFDVIYELVDWLKVMLEERVPAETVRKEEGKLKVLKVFKKVREKQIVGGKVISGTISKGEKFEIVRNGETRGIGKITNAQKNKVDANEISEGAECGISVEAADIMEGDTLVTFIEETIKKDLTSVADAAS